MKKMKANIMVDATGQQKLTISEGCVIHSITPKGGKVLLLDVSISSSTHSGYVESIKK